MKILIIRFLLHSLLVNSFFVSNAFAQPSGARADNFIYKVLKNDTLVNLSEKFTDSANNWNFLQKLNNVADPHQLQIGLELNIPFSMIPVSSANAQVINVNGSAKINNDNLSLNSVVKEGDIIKTNPNSFITIQMPDFSLVMVPGDSTLNIKRLRTFSKTGIIDSILLLDSGQIESVVAPNNTGTGRFEIRTPVSVTGVRGTNLRVRVNNDNALTEVTAGVVQLGLDESDGPNLNQNQGSLFNSTTENIADNIRQLPAAPQIITNEEEASSSNKIHFNHVDNAEHYIITVAADPEGAIVANKSIVNASPASFSSPGAGYWYVLVRSVDTNGFHSLDSVIKVEGANILKSGFGLPVKSGFLDNILLSY